MTTIQFSFYELSLLSFLRESHPDKSDDVDFIRTRAVMAAEAYSDAFDNGYSIPECVDMANQTLYLGLHFSKHDTIVSVLLNEFSAEVPADDAKTVTIGLQPLLDELFAEYALSDEFGYCPEYQSLYTEIAGILQLKLEDDGCL